jgi:hypothetical protein
MADLTLMQRILRITNELHVKKNGKNLKLSVAGIIKVFLKIFLLLTVPLVPSYRWNSEHAYSYGPIFQHGRCCLADGNDQLA